MDLMAVLLLFIGIGIGFFIGFFFKKSKSNLNEDSSEVIKLSERLNNAITIHNEQKEQIAKLSNLKDELISNNSQLKEANQNLEIKLKEHKVHS
jgi:uncharacterized membrane protein YgaE (UPF0421/DUF939 family)